MVQEIPVHPAWERQVVATRSRGGPIMVLLTLRKRCCSRCRYGDFYETVWASQEGDACRITWCRSCFDADFAPVELEGDLRGEWRERVEPLRLPTCLPYWTAARPAIEDLERRGLV